MDDGDGRLITFEHSGKELLNVYVLNGERERRVFFENFGVIYGENCMVVGDFTVVWEVGRDCECMF